MNLKTLVGLTSLGAAGAVLGGYLLRRRPRALRYTVGGAAFLLPFGVYALTGSPRPLTTFLFISDTHGAAAQNALLVKALLRQSNVDFLIHGGDIADDETWWVRWWDTPFAQVIRRWHIYATQGNHDPEAGFRQRFVDPPYKISAKGADIFVIPYAVNATVATWLDRETAASTAPFRILVTHRPVWAAASGESSNLPTLLAASLPRLSLVLAGHNHVSQDTLHMVGSHPLRQIIEKSGPKNYACDPQAVNCLAGSTGFLRVEVYSDRIDVRREVVR